MSETKSFSVEVLITTLRLEDPIELLRKMNIDSEAMIGNQSTYNDIQTINYKENSIPIYTFKEKGVGLNRNNLLMRSKADICLFGDDDLIYKDNYSEILNFYFKKYPDADVLAFNLEEENSKRYVIEKEFKVNKLNFMRFGAARIAIKRRPILQNGILFNTCFGGGTEYSNGEDTLFINACLNAKLKMYAINKTIAHLTNERDSTWFSGYNEKYLKDKGALYYIMDKRFYKLLILQDCIRHKNTYQMKSIYSIFKLMSEGASALIKENC